MSLTALFSKILGTFMESKYIKYVKKIDALAKGIAQGGGTLKWAVQSNVGARWNEQCKVT